MWHMIFTFRISNGDKGQICLVENVTRMKSGLKIFFVGIVMMRTAFSLHSDEINTNAIYVD